MEDVLVAALYLKKKKKNNVQEDDGHWMRMAQRWVTDMPLFHCGRSYGSSICEGTAVALTRVASYTVLGFQNLQGYMHTIQRANGAS